MLRSRIAPCLLLEQGELVKTRQFASWKYIGDPMNAVRIFNEKRVDELVLLDIEATVRDAEPDFELLAKISAEARMPLCYGGGIRTAATAERLTSIGFEKVSLSAAAIERPALVREVAEAVGSQSVCVTLDVKRSKAGAFEIYTHRGARRVELDLREALHEFQRLGAGEIVVNAIDRDGMMAGYDLELARVVRDTVDTPLTFVGGAGSSEDMKRLIAEVGTCGAAAGSLFVFNGKYHAVLLSYSRPRTDS